MRTASASASKWTERASAASPDYVAGVQNTQKDQAALAIAAAPIWGQALQAAITAGSYAKGLTRSGKAGWQAGVQAKGQTRYSEGVSTAGSKYATNSGAYDNARQAAASMPRGLKGSSTNLARVSAVVAAERAAKTGKS